MTTGQRRFQQVGSVAGALLAARANQGMDLVDKQHDRHRARLYLFDKCLEPGLEFTLHAGARLQHADIQQPELYVTQRLRDVACGDTQRQPFHHRGFTHPGLAGQQRVVLATTHQNIHHLADLFIAAYHRVNFAVAGAGGQILPVLREAALRRGRGGVVIGDGDSLGRLFAVGEYHVEIIQQRIHPYPLKLRGDAFQHRRQAPGFQQADQQVAAANTVDAKFQRAVNPGALNGGVDMLREIGDRACAAREAVQRADDIPRQRLFAKGKVADHLLQIALLLLHQGVDPVHQLHIGVAAQFAKGGGAFQ